MNGSNLSGTPSNADVGSYWVNVSVSDGNGGVDWHNFTLTVSNVNDAPVIATVSAPDGSVEMEYAYLMGATDPDGDALLWSLEGPSWLSIDASTGLLSGVPGTAGNFSVNVSVSDGNGGTDSVSFSIYVNADADGDGVNNTDDAYPLDPSRWEAPVEYHNETVWAPIKDVYLNDTDGDGMPDSWELLYGLDPNSSADASGDPDEDGITNLQEYRDGTSPTYANNENPPNNGITPAESSSVLLPAILALLLGIVIGAVAIAAVKRKTSPPEEEPVDEEPEEESEE